MLNILRRVIRLISMIMTIIYVTPIIFLGYIYGITTISFKFGLTLANIVSTKAINNTIERVKQNG